MNHEKSTRVGNLGSCPNLTMSEWVKSLSHVRLFATPWTITYQAPPSMGFSRQEYWRGLPISFSRGSSWPRDQTQVFRIAGRCFNLWAKCFNFWSKVLGWPCKAGSRQDTAAVFAALVEEKEPIVGIDIRLAHPLPGKPAEGHIPHSPSS